MFWYSALGNGVLKKKRCHVKWKGASIGSAHVILGKVYIFVVGWTTVTFFHDCEVIRLWVCVRVCVTFTINFAYTVPGEIRTMNRNRVSLILPSPPNEVLMKYERRNQNGVSTQNTNSHTPQCERVYMSITRTSFSFRHTTHTHRILPGYSRIPYCLFFLSLWFVRYVQFR